jgi:hypothetical protein
VILATFVLSWLSVTQDCHGAAEAVPPVYEIWTYRQEISGSYVGPDGSPWPVYTRTQMREMVPGTSVPIADPSLGGVVAWGDPVAVDAAGNRSGEPCN